MSLNGKIDNNIWVSIDGKLKQLRPLVAQVEKELADYKKHFEPQMIQIRLLEKAHTEQALTFRR